MEKRPDSTLLRLALEVQKLTSQIVDDLSSKDLPEPNFSATSPGIPETTESFALRSSLKDAALDLLRLVNGPRTNARTRVCTMYDLGAWQVACELGFFEAVPEDGVANLGDIAKTVGMDEDRVRRFLQILATDRISEEVEEDVFRHTSRSVVCLQDLQIRDAVHYQLDEYFKAASETATSIRSSPFVTDHSNNPFVSRHGTELFKFYQQEPKKAGRFASAMAGIGKMERQFEDLRDSYPWHKLNKGKVIDVGGGNGHMSIALARSAFQQHSFFERQPVLGAAAYLLRNVTHNWNDESCIRILKALVPALEQNKPGTPLLIDDIVLPTLGASTLYHGRHLRQVDIMMMVVLGAKQRTAADFQRLLTKGDHRLKIKQIHGGGNMSLIEAYLDFH